jgi:hypothetical protein
VVAIGLLSLGVLGLVVLHVVRSELSPISDRLSEYANGPYGPVMTASFMAFGAAAVVLGVAMARVGATTGWARMVPLAIIAAGCGLIVSGVFPTDPTGAPTTTETVHSLASGSASLALIAAAITSAVLGRACHQRRPFEAATVLAWLALGLGAISPVLHGSRWTGLSQRLLWLALTAWLFVTAWQVLSRRSTARPPAGRLRTSR